MLNPSRRESVVRSIALVAGFLACMVLAPTSSLQAQAEGAANPNWLRVRLATMGTQSFLAPYAHVVVSEPAYVAVFEIHPDVGALMLYPSAHADQGWVARSVSFNLSGLVLNQYRREFRRLNQARFLYASHARSRGYLVAIASRRPLDTSLLESGRILEASGAAAEPYDIVKELVSLIVPAQPASDWSYDVYGFYKNQEPALAYLLSPGYFVNERALFGYPGSFCYSPGLAFTFGLYPTAYLGSCGLTRYGWYAMYGRPFGYGGYAWWWTNGSNWDGWAWNYPPRGQPRTAGPVDTRGMTPGTPRYRNRPRVVDDPGAPAVVGKVAEGREKPVQVTDPAGSSPGRVTDARQGRKGVTDAKKPGASSQDPADASERFREILDQLGDASSTAVIGPQTLIRNQAAFARLGLRTTPHLAYRMEAQAIAAQRRLESRLQSMGVSAREASAAAGQRGAAPRITRLIGGSAAVVRPSSPGRSYGGRGATANGRTTTVRGASRVRRARVSRPAPPRARPVSRPAPRAPVRASPPAPRPHSSHGGGGGHGQH